MKYELYRFANGTKSWYFTSAARKKEFNGNMYLPVDGLQRTEIEDAGIDKSDIDISLSFPQSLKNENDEDFAQYFYGRLFIGKTYITIIEVDGATSQVIFNGRVTANERDRDGKTLNLKCSTGEADHENQVHTRKHQRTCPNAIYDRWCGLDFEKWSYPILITVVDGINITFQVQPTQVRDENGDLVFEQIPLLDENDEPVLDDEDQPIMIDGDPVMETKTIAPDFLRLGMLKKDGFRITITGNTSGTVTLYHRHHGLKVGDFAELAPGCNKSIEMCSERYQNNRRFGGNPNIPNENPVGSQLMK